MSRIISIIKDRHLGDFEYNLDRKTVRCLRACDYRVFIENDYEQIEVRSAIDDDSFTASDFLSDSMPVTPVYINITKETIERYAKAECYFDLGEEPQNDLVLEDYRDMVLEQIRLAPDHPTIWDDVREMLNLPAPKYERVR
jgi:hypothetical protein